MNNYEHEILCPDNKGIRNYLWYDYFHDSKIHSIHFDYTKGLVSLILECNRDMNKAWEQFKGNESAYKAYVHEHSDAFTYILSFKNTAYFHMERLSMVNDYLNGRFKDTALLKKLSLENKRPLFHFRIQVDDGYIDIVFSDFMIQKKQGRVKYPIAEIACTAKAAATADIKKAALEEDDFGRFLAMKKLYESTAPELLEIARRNLRLTKEDGDSCLYAAYLLGKLGDPTDIPNLLELYFNFEEFILSKSICRCSALLPRRNIMDAIELIQERHP